MRRSLQNKVLPVLPAGSSADFTARSMHELLVFAQHRSTPGFRAPDRGRAADMAQAVRRITAAQVDTDAAKELVAILRADSRFYREDAAAFKALLATALGESEQIFELPDEGQLTAIVKSWTGDDKARARIVDQAVGGYSKQTVFFDCIAGNGAVEHLVMRRDLPFAEGRSSVIDEYAVLKAVFQTKVPVAEPLYLERNPAVLQTPFLISRRVPGRLMGNSLGLKEKPDFQPPEALGTLLAQLHTIDVSTLALPGFSDVPFDLHTQRLRIEQWIDIYRANADLPAAALEIGLAWLLENSHLIAGERALVHGDVGYHNILFHQGKVAALVDWELVRVGNPAEDLAYVGFCMDAPAEFIDCYVAAGGRRPTEGAMTYCQVFGNVRNALYGVVGMRQFNDGRHDDVSMLPIILHSYWAYMGALDEYLGRILETRGFRWAEPVTEFRG